MLVRSACKDCAAAVFMLVVFILLIIDNGSYGSAGDQPNYGGNESSLDAVVAACRAVECRAEAAADTLQAASPPG